MNEEWKNIKGWEGIYQISSFGRVRRLTTRGGRELPEPKILKEKYDGNGYPQVALSNRKCQYKHVHRLVAEMFIPNPNNLREINHKDEDKKNNHIENLEWCTHQYNATYGTKLIRYAKNRGIAVKQYDMNGNFIKNFYSASQASFEVFGKNWCSKILDCCDGKREHFHGFIWEYDQTSMRVLRRLRDEFNTKSRFEI